MDKKKDRWINRKIDGQKERQMDKNKDRWMKRKMGGKRLI